MMPPDLSAWGGDTANLRPVAGGARRHLWRATLGGRAVVAKSNALHEPSLRWQLRIEGSARRAGFDTPGLIFTTRGALSSAGWTLEPWLTGRPATGRDVAGLRLAPFHRAARHLPQRPGPIRRLPHKWPILTKLPGPCGGIHGDLHAGNVLRLTSGQWALLDWEEARCGPLAIDHAAQAVANGGKSTDHLRSEIIACAISERDRAIQMARALMARRWP